MACSEANGLSAGSIDQLRTPPSHTSTATATDLNAGV